MFARLPTRVPLLACGCLLAAWAADIAVQWRNEELHISAPRLHFISGAAQDRLKNGGAVPYDFQLQVWSNSRSAPLARSLERFVVSYDLWEEKYSVTKLRGSVVARENKTVSHLNAAAAETWCLDNISLGATSLPADQPLHFRLEIRAGEPKPDTGLVGESGVSLSRLIEIFSNPARREQQRWTLETGPLRLSDLKRNTRGT